MTHPVASANRVRPGSLSDRVRQALGRQCKPVSAYAITEALQQETGKRHFPNSIYRSLQWLATKGEVLQVVSVNGWLLRTAAPSAPTMILLCKNCGVAQQLVQPEVLHAIQVVGKSSGFKVRETHVEVLGTCQDCNIGVV